MAATPDGDLRQGEPAVGDDQVRLLGSATIAASVTTSRSTASVPGGHSSSATRARRCPAVRAEAAAAATMMAAIPDFMSYAPRP
jgi:hypothetical protein